MTKMLPREQWTLLNLLWRRTSSNVARVAAAMLTFADAAVDDLDDLREQGLITGVRKGSHLWCPECEHPVRNSPPAPALWRMPAHVPVPRTSHFDATPLCLVYGPEGAYPATPIESAVTAFAGLSVPTLQRIHLDLTTAGRRWVVDDPLNKVVAALTERSWPLRQVIREYALDLTAVVMCMRAGHVEVRDVQTGAEVAPTIAALTAAMRERFETTWIDLTATGWRLAYPGADPRSERAA